MLPFWRLEFWSGTYFRKSCEYVELGSVRSRLIITARNFMFYAWNRLDLNYSYILMRVYPYSAEASVVFKFKVGTFCDARRNTRPEVNRYWPVDVAAKTVNAIICPTDWPCDFFRKTSVSLFHDAVSCYVGIACGGERGIWEHWWIIWTGETRSVSHCPFSTVKRI